MAAMVKTMVIPQDLIGFVPQHVAHYDQYVWSVASFQRAAVDLYGLLVVQGGKACGKELLPNFLKDFGPFVRMT